MKQLLIEIEPKPKTVLELFEGHPERWTKRCMFRSERNNSCPRIHAISACLSGAINFVYYDESKPELSGGPEFAAACARVEEVIEKEYSYMNVPHFNDSSNTSFEQVLELCKRASI